MASRARKGAGSAGESKNKQELFEYRFAQASEYLQSAEFRLLLMENAPPWAIGQDNGKSYRGAVIGSVLTACETSKDYQLLLDCDFQSMVEATVRIIRRGLTVGDNIAWLVPYWSETRQTKIVQDQLGYMGLYTLALRFGLVTKGRCQPVFENDTLDIELGSDPKVTHKPPKIGSRGEFVGVYSIVTTPDGAVDVEWADKDTIEHFRQMAPSKNSPAWTNWYTEQARAKVFKRHLKRVPKPISYDPSLFTDMDDVIEGKAERVETPALEAPRERPMENLQGFVKEQRQRDRVEVRTQRPTAEDMRRPPADDPPEDEDDGSPTTQQTTQPVEDVHDDPAVSLMLPGASSPRYLPLRKAQSELVRECGEQFGRDAIRWIEDAMRANSLWLAGTPTIGVLQSLIDRLENDQ